MQRTGASTSITRDLRRPGLTADRPRSRLRISTLTGAVLLAAALLAGCGQDEHAREVASRQADPDTARAAPMDGLAAADDLGPLHLLAFACGEVAPYLAVLDPDGDTVALYSGDGVHILEQQPAASGAKYADERHVLWSKGHHDVMLEIDGEQLEGCEPTGRQRVLTAAYQGGFVLRASGNEPFWTMLAGSQSIRLDQLDRPSTSFAGLAEGDLADGGTVEREAGPHRLRVTVTREHCLDTMSGEPSPLTVTIELDDETLRGCGVWLAP